MQTDVERALRESEERFRELIQHSADLIMLMDAEGKGIYESASVQRILGYEPASDSAPDIFELVHPNDLDQARAFLAALTSSPGATMTIELRVRHADGDWRWLESVGANLLHHPSVRAIVLNSRDITERKVLEAALARQAFHDALTGLPNRALLLDRIDHALARLRREPSGLALLFLDLDDFKLVNDSLGHMLGDALLAEVATRLLHCVRGVDTVARFGGDEFAILLTSLHHDDEATVVAQRIHDTLARPASIGGREFHVSASVGIALGRGESTTADDLLRWADAAMYRAKGLGKGRHATF